MKPIQLLIIVLLSLFCLFNIASAQDFHVTTAQEFQTALKDAEKNVESDRVFLAAGVYKGVFSYSSANPKDLSISAEPGLNPGQVVLDDGEQDKRVLTINGGNGLVNIFIIKITIQNGNSSYSGGLYITTGGNVYINSCCIKNNKNNNVSQYAGNSGGIYIGKANYVIVKNNNFLNNIAQNFGGGLYIYEAQSIDIEDNNFLRNECILYHYDIGGTAVCVHNVPIVNIKNNFISENVNNNSRAITQGTIRVNYSTLLTISNNIITNNTVVGHGGAIYIQSSSTKVLIENNLFSNNSSSEGGAVYINAKGVDTVIFNNNTLQNNRASNKSGAVYINDSNNISFNSNIINNNTAQNYYGAICIYDDDNIVTNNFSFTNNFLIENTSISNDYAGLYVKAIDITFKNNLVAKNSAPNGHTGGLSLTSSGIMHFINNTIVDNHSKDNDESEGGVFFSITGPSYIYNNIISNNTGLTGRGDLFMEGGGSRRYFFNNIINEMTATWDYAENNENITPEFIDPDTNDYHLVPSSPCIDYGTVGIIESGYTNYASVIPDTDLEGNPRVANNKVDVGAYEHDSTIKHPADINSDNIITLEEYTTYGDHWRNGYTWTTDPNPIPIDYVTRAGFLLESGGNYKNVGGGKPGCWVPNQ